MAKRNKYRSSKASDFFDYMEGKLSEQERNAFERRMQKDSFESDAAEGFSMVSREEAEQDLQSAAAGIRMRVEGETSRNSVGRNSSQSPDNYSQPDGNLKTGGEWWISGNRKIGQSRRIGQGRKIGQSRRIAWYSAAAAIASLMIVTTIFFRLNDNGLERFETAPEMREAAREQSAPLQEIVSEPNVPEGEEAKKKLTPAQEADLEQAEQVAEAERKQGKVTGEGSKKQAEQVVEGAKEMEKVTDKGVRKAEIQMEPLKELMVVDVPDEAAAKEDHAFAWEKMDEAAAAGRYRPSEQRKATAESPPESKTAFTPQPKPEAAAEPKNAKDIQAPLAAKDPVMQEQEVADISYQPTGTVKFESAVPANGPADFRSYIDSALVYPELTETSGKEVVVLKFTVSPNGRPQNFRVVRAPDQEAFANEAIRIVSEGPAWLPAKLNGQYTEEEVRLRIVFRKE
jgi:TonB family protein